jgi:hypothetical protein
LIIDEDYVAGKIDAFEIDNEKSEIISIKRRSTEAEFLDEIQTKV